MNFKEKIYIADEVFEEISLSRPLLKTKNFEERISNTVLKRMTLETKDYQNKNLSYDEFFDDAVEIIKQVRSKFGIKNNLLVDILGLREEIGELSDEEFELYMCQSLSCRELKAEKFNKLQLEQQKICVLRYTLELLDEKETTFEDCLCKTILMLKDMYGFNIDVKEYLNTPKYEWDRLLNALMDLLEK